MQSNLFKKLILFLIFFSIYSYSWAWEEFDYYLYKGSTGETTTVAWDDQPYDPNVPGSWCPLVKFQIKIYNVERDIYFWIDKAIPRNVFEYTYSFPKTGHWISMIRVDQKCELPYRDPASPECNNHNEVDKEDGHEYSEWSESTNSDVSIVNGMARGWWHFTWIAAPGPF